MLLVAYRPDRHELIDTEIARFLRRHLNRSDLFTYRHRLSGRWEVARWIGPNREFEELYGFQSPGDFDRAAVTALTAWHQSTLPGRREVEASYRQIEAAERRAQEDELRDSRDRMRYIGRKLNSDDPTWKRDGLPFSWSQE